MAKRAEKKGDLLITEQKVYKACVKENKGPLYFEKGKHLYYFSFWDHR